LWHISSSAVRFFPKYGFGSFGSSSVLFPSLILRQSVSQSARVGVRPVNKILLLLSGDSLVRIAPGRVTH